MDGTRPRILAQEDLDRQAALQEGRVLFNTAAYVVVLALLWVMVRTRFLFRVIPI